MNIENKIKTYIKQEKLENELSHKKYELENLNEEKAKQNKQLKEEYNKIQKAYESTFSDYQQLKDNWNKLRDYVLKKQAILFDTEYTCYSNVLDKMQELERANNNVKD